MASFSRPLPRLLLAAAVAVIAVTAVMFMAIQATQKPKAAWADTIANLNEAHIGATAADFGTPDCSGPLANPPGPGYDGWHFVLPDSSGDNFTSVTIVFENGGDVTAGPITSTDPNNPDSGPGWVGFLDATGSGDVKHAYIFTTPAGLKIKSGTATVSPNQQEEGTFNLSHTCPASASPSPSPSPSRSVSPSPSVSPSRSVSPSPSASTSPAPSPSISTSPTPSASTSRPPRPSPSRTRPPGYGYGSTEHMTIRTSWWRSYFG